jgi:hypothetical protein
MDALPHAQPALRRERRKLNNFQGTQPGYGHGAPAHQQRREALLNCLRKRAISPADRRLTAEYTSKDYPSRVSEYENSASVLFTLAVGKSK